MTHGLVVDGVTLECLFFFFSVSGLQTDLGHLPQPGSPDWLPAPRRLGCSEGPDEVSSQRSGNTRGREDSLREAGPPVA